MVNDMVKGRQYSAYVYSLSHIDVGASIAEMEPTLDLDTDNF